MTEVETGSFLQRLVKHATYYPKHSAIITENKEINYAYLLKKVQASASYLLSNGINDKSIVGISIDDEFEHLIATLSLLILGASQITLPTLDTNTLNSISASEVGVTHVLSTNKKWELENIAFVIWNPDIMTVADLIEFTYSSQNEGSIFLRTSGTTGKSKIIELSEMQLSMHSQRHSDYRNECFLRLAPIEYNNSKRHRLYCVWAGGTNVFRPYKDELIPFCLHHHVTCLDASRVHISDLLLMDDAEKLKGVKIRSGGMATPYVQRKKVIENITPEFYARYATTEMGTIAIATPNDHDEEETVGRVLESVTFDIVDQNHLSVKVGETGEIRVKFPGMMTEYYNNPQENAKCFHEGWFYPGDMGRIREDGQLVITGRKDDMIILNGINIYPAEIESVLERHPDVLVAASLPMPSDVHGQIPVAAVTIKNNAAISPSQLLRYCKQKIGIRMPRKIIIVSEFPRNTQGKILKNELLKAFYD